MAIEIVDLVDLPIKHCVFPYPGLIDQSYSPIRLVIHQLPKLDLSKILHNSLQLVGPP